MSLKDTVKARVSQWSTKAAERGSGVEAEFARQHEGHNLDSLSETVSRILEDVEDLQRSQTEKSKPHVVIDDNSQELAEALEQIEDLKEKLSIDARNIKDVLKEMVVLKSEANEALEEAQNIKVDIDTRLEGFQSAITTLHKDLGGETAEHTCGDMKISASKDHQGNSGNNLTSECKVAGNNTPLSLVVNNGKNLVINLATDGGGAALSTADDVIAEYDNNALASLKNKFVIVVSGTGTNIQSSESQFSLTNGNGSLNKGHKLLPSM